MVLAEVTSDRGLLGPKVQNHPVYEESDDLPGTVVSSRTVARPIADPISPMKIRYGSAWDLPRFSCSIESVAKMNTD